MNLIVSGVHNAIQVRREGVISHLPCHSAVVRVTHPSQPEISIHAVFTSAPHQCWMIGAAGRSQQANDSKNTLDYSVQIADDASVEIITDDCDRTSLY